MSNPLLAEWTGPYGGFPPFDQVRVEHFAPGLDALMEERIAAVEGIAASREAATFENTVVALERASRRYFLGRSIYGIWQGNLSTPEFQAVAREMAPKLAAHQDRIYQNEALFRRLDAVMSSPEMATLTGEERRLVERIHLDFVRSGARLDPESKRRVAELNGRLAGLFRQFSDNLLADQTDQFIVLEEDELGGLPESVRNAAAAAAAARGLDGKWVIQNVGPSVRPFLTFSSRRDLREKAYRMFVSRGDRGGETDNKVTIAGILEARAERARLRGYPSHAHYMVETQMAKTPERALELMESVWGPALDRVREEVADMAAVRAREAGENGAVIEPWDYRYYAEKVRQERFSLDEDEIMQYLQLDRLKEALFWVADELFGFEFEGLHDVPVFHPDVQVWRVTDRATGGHVGLWYFDPFARTGKRSGAWMNSYRRQDRLGAGTTAIVSNNTNFSKPSPDDPVLISWSDAETLFHEFGHALNGLASNVRYPSLSGTPPERDYVEFPSQLLEHWLSTPEVLRRFALHHETGEPIPQALVGRIEEAATFNQGFETASYLSSALLDMRLHLHDEPPTDPHQFEREALAGIGMPREVGMIHRLPHFYHVFDSDNYSAAYYGYLWADVLTADAHEAFLEAGSLYDEELLARLREHIFSAGSSLDPEEGYRRFRGRDADVGALLRKRGLVAGAAR
ncbi:MAG TPA: M3 family metallopeptidase [Longimicrobiaceae bacterium]|nr:M3 family metallopeptidase [Longimicrobiaceae bacterium]